MTSMASAFLSVGLTVFASAQPNVTNPVSPRAAITAAYASMDRALIRHDVTAYAAHLYPTFVGVYPQGKEMHGRAEDAASLHQLFAVASAVTSSTRLLTLAFQDGGAVVTTRETFSMSMQADGQPVSVKSVGTLRGFWVRSGGHWLLKAERSLSDTTTMNGEETKTVNGQPVAGAAKA